MGIITKIYAICASEKFAMKFNLSAGNRHDAPKSRKLIKSIDSKVARYLLMNCDYEDDETRALVLKQGLIFVVPPKKNRKSPWKYDTEIYKRCNEVECFCSRLQ